MEQILGYWKTIKQYYTNTKGRHDILDYGRAMMMIFLVMVLVIVVVYALNRLF